MRRNPERPQINADNWSHYYDQALVEAKEQWSALARSGEKDLAGAYLEKANLYKASLFGVNLSDAWLYYASLDDARLGGANLQRAVLVGAGLNKAYLKDADLSGADLYEADLTGADLRGANLKGANLTRVDLYDAKLQGANLVGVNLMGANIKGAQFDTLPKYFGLLRSVGLTDLSALKYNASVPDEFYGLRQFFRDRGQDSFGELLELEMRLEREQARES